MALLKSGIDIEIFFYRPNDVINSKHSPHTNPIRKSHQSHSREQCSPTNPNKLDKLLDGQHKVEISGNSKGPKFAPCGTPDSDTCIIFLKLLLKRNSMKQSKTPMKSNLCTVSVQQRPIYHDTHVIMLLNREPSAL